MPARFWEIAFTDDVLATQRDAYGATFATPGGLPDETLGEDEREFVEGRDSFYMATTSASGWPYVQHRGGPRGFLRVLDPRTIGFADVRGNRQLVSTGNLASNDRVALILVDYKTRQRLKILGHATHIDARTEPDLAASFAPDGQANRVERIIVIRVVAYDWNCPQQITPRFTQDEVEAHTAPLIARVAELEAALQDRQGRG